MSRHTQPGVGDQELLLLRFISDHGTASVAETVREFAEPKALTRSTVVTMLERLRRKGHLRRHMVGGVYRYTPKTTPGAIVRQAIGAFVDKTLGGSVEPFVSYLAERETFSPAEIERLEDLLDRLRQPPSRR